MTVLARRRWLGALALAYPALVLLTIVATANHFVIDAAAGGLVMAVGVGGAHLAHRRRGGATGPGTTPGRRRTGAGRRGR